MTEIRSTEFFEHVISGYARQYARENNPLDDGAQRSGTGFGHAASILDAVKHRKTWVNNIKTANKNFTEDELVAAKAEALEKFEYDIILKRRPISGIGPVQQILAVGFYDRDNIAELMEEALQIARGNFHRVIPVAERFGVEPVPIPPEYDPRDLWKYEL